MFSCEFCEISKNSFFYRTPLVAASVKQNSVLVVSRRIFSIIFRNYFMGHLWTIGPLMKNIPGCFTICFREIGYSSYRFYFLKNFHSNVPFEMKIANAVNIKYIFSIKASTNYGKTILKVVIIARVWKYRISFDSCLSRTFSLVVI